MRAFGQTLIPSVHSEYPQINDNEKLLVTTSVRNWKGFVDFVNPLKCSEIVEQLHHLNELPYNVWSLSKLNFLERWQALNYRDTKIRLRTLIKLLESVEVIFQYAQGGNLQHTNKLEQSLKDIENRISGIYELKCLFHDNRMIEDLDTILSMIKSRKSEKEDLAISPKDFYLKKIKAQKKKLEFDLRYL